MIERRGESHRAAEWRRYRELLRGEPLPLALVDLDALDRNVATIVARVRGTGKTLRVASKSVRCPALLRHIVARGGADVRGVMAFSAAEARFLAREGVDDLLVAYPTAHPVDARLVAEANRDGARVSIAVDCPEHLDVLARAASSVGATVPVVVDVDVSFRPLGDRAHLGVRRSPLHGAGEVADLAERVVNTPGLAFAGLLAYEAHIAGLPDRAPDPVVAAARRALKGVAKRPVRELRRAIAQELARRGIPIPLFNGGGTGSVGWSSADPSLTEVAAGSGFLDSHLFDGYDGLALEPAAFFALQATRRPAPGIVTCQGGGYVASGAAGPDRLPIPWMPEGLRLLAMEGAGEVQTPLAVPDGVAVALGDPVLFRHAKAGELAEHFNEYLLVRGDRVEARAPTYRGLGHCFA